MWSRHLYYSVYITSNRTVCLFLGKHDNVLSGIRTTLFNVSVLTQNPVNGNKYALTHLRPNRECMLNPNKHTYQCAINAHTRTHNAATRQPLALPFAAHQHQTHMSTKAYMFSFARAAHEQWNLSARPPHRLSGDRRPTLGGRQFSIIIPRLTAIYCALYVYSLTGLFQIEHENVALCLVTEHTRPHTHTHLNSREHTHTHDRTHTHAFLLIYVIKKSHAIGERWLPTTTHTPIRCHCSV